MNNRLKHEYENQTPRAKTRNIKNYFLLEQAHQADMAGKDKHFHYSRYGTDYKSYKVISAYGRNEVKVTQEYMKRGLYWWDWSQN